MTDDSVDILKAPFTEDQVKAITEYQQESPWHQYTCYTDSQHPTLVASTDGLICNECGHVQNWVFASTADGSWKTNYNDLTKHYEDRLCQLAQKWRETHDGELISQYCGIIYLLLAIDWDKDLDFVCELPSELMPKEYFNH